MIILSSIVMDSFRGQKDISTIEQLEKGMTGKRFFKMYISLYQEIFSKS